mmetsp:Transcript_13054/g.41718  ORF Transcript_13054/g.41718 Transcript_13054/m.41718 type:complete len:215 (-) Transcript_13054:70-714(-)
MCASCSCLSLRRSSPQSSARGCPSASRRAPRRSSSTLRGSSRRSSPPPSPACAADCSSLAACVRGSTGVGTSLSSACRSSRTRRISMRLSATSSPRWASTCSGSSASASPSPSRSSCCPSTPSSGTCAGASLATAPTARDRDRCAREASADSTERGVPRAGARAPKEFEVGAGYEVRATPHRFPRWAARAGAPPRESRASPTVHAGSLEYSAVV